MRLVQVPCLVTCQAPVLIEDWQDQAVGEPEPSIWITDPGPLQERCLRVIPEGEVKDPVRCQAGAKLDGIGQPACSLELPDHRRVLLKLSHGVAVERDHDLAGGGIIGDRPACMLGSRNAHTLRWRSGDPFQEGACHGSAGCGREIVKPETAGNIGP
jgi:hypothetical protein